MQVQNSGNKRSRISIASAFGCALVALSLFVLTAQYAHAGVIPPGRTQISTITGTGGLGTWVHDTAVFSGAEGQGVPTGSVTFYLCGPTQTMVPCTSITATLVSTNPLVQVVPPSGSTPDGASGATSANIQLTKAGWYCFRVHYSGTPGNPGYYEPSTLTSTTNECIFIGTASAVTINSFDAQPQSVSAMSTNESMGWELGIAGVLALGLTAVVLIRKR